MRKKYGYREDLIKRLKNPKYATQYLNAALGDSDRHVFLLALRDVVEAHGGMSNFSRRAKIPRISLYRMLSKSGNPEIKSLENILKPMGLGLIVTDLESINLRKAA